MPAEAGNTNVDVLVVGLGATAGLRAADRELCRSLERAGASVALAQARAPGYVRTLMLTDLLWARAARRVAIPAIERHRPRAVVYSSTTAALLWPRPGAIYFDSLSTSNRPGRHGLWQRSVERRRIAGATVLIPWSATNTKGVRSHAPVVVVPPPIRASGASVVSRDITALTYCENAHKKGLDRILAAWAIARRDGEELVVTGPSEPSHESSVRYTGMLAPDEYRTLLRRARVYVTAPRREDHGIAQLEALADGAQLVTTSAPGAYPALAMARDLDPRLVAEDPDDPWALAAALRAALDGGQASYSARAALALVPYTSAVIDEVVARSLLPCLLRR